MADVEIKKKSRLTRKEAGERLIALGTRLTEGSVAELAFDDDSIKFAVADHVEWELELEVDGDEVELEIELKWSDAVKAAPSGTAKRTTGKRRGGTAG
ncbi:amphi-Trp domain-containing protein [Actinoplanes aureus]|uniref:Amphi-Trp domain-containing protein n=1 Tax=Actinoplanes aureus TaxID=2792083 RepID=A0A931CLZ0_9ACTN|nr:amphi-Trp domain-containing protein [Actinoplanes aureus]MBG0568728.1 amphi-Trp domain-containing protein [Actinoplanes aureus]